MNGSIQYLNGTVIVKDPKGEGRNAILHTPPSITLQINGKEIKNWIEVSQKDIIEIIPMDEKAKRVFNIRVKEDGLLVYGSIQYYPGKRIEILDSEPVQELKLQVNIQEELPNKYTPKEILQELKEAKIVYGIKEEAIQEVIENPGKEYLIAEGKPRKSGEDGFIEYFFQDNKKKVHLEDVNVKVNYKSLHQIPTVRKEELLARKTPAIAGKPGIDVYGKTLKIPIVKDPSLVPGNHVKIDPEGLNAYSMIDGKPTLQGKVIHVFSVYEQSGDVNIKTGNIEFLGDVIIHGNVTEGMSIKAQQDVIVHGFVSGAKIEAGGQVFVKDGVIKSHITTGKEQTLLHKVYYCIEKLNKLFLQLYKASKEVLGTVNKSIKPNIAVYKIVSMVMEKHFKEITNILKELELIDKAKIMEIIDDSFYNNIQYFTKRYSVYGLFAIKELEDIKKDIVLLAKMKEILSSQFKQPKNVTLSYSQNAIIKASGDIIFTGQGGLNSSLFAGGGVYMSDVEDASKLCVFRGGKIQCNKDICINKIGSEGGAYTEIETSRPGKIIFNALYYNTRIKIGESERKIERVMKKGICYRNKKGEIVINTLNK